MGENNILSCLLSMLSDKQLSQHKPSHFYLQHNSVIFFLGLIKWDFFFHYKLEPSQPTLMTPPWEHSLLKVHKRWEDRRGKKRGARGHNGSGVPFSRLRALSHFNTLVCDCHYRKGFTMCVWVEEMLQTSLLHTHTHTHRNRHFPTCTMTKPCIRVSAQPSRGCCHCRVQIQMCVCEMKKDSKKRRQSCFNAIKCGFQLYRMAQRVHRSDFPPYVCLFVQFISTATLWCHS